MARLLLVLALALTGCATVEIARVNGPDGLMYEATCYHSPRECYNGIADACGGEYHVLEKSDSAGIANIGNVNGQAQYASYTTHRVFFRCGEAPAH